MTLFERRGSKNLFADSSGSSCRHHCLSPTPSLSPELLGESSKSCS